MVNSEADNPTVALHVSRARLTNGPETRNRTPSCLIGGAALRSPVFGRVVGRPSPHHDPPPRYEDPAILATTESGRRPETSAKGAHARTGQSSWAAHGRWP
jgi:hypothetical protein